METSVTIQLIGLVGTALTVAGGFLVAWLVNRREKEESAENAMEETLRERIILRDEQIDNLVIKLDRAQSDYERCKHVNDALREDLAREKEKLYSLQQKLWALENRTDNV